MAKQAKPRFGMVEQGKCCLRRVKVFSLMVRMAGKATRDVLYQAVRPILATDLLSHAAVAVQTQSVLRGLERLVTAAAICLDVGV